MPFNHGLNETEKQLSNTNIMPQSIKLTADQIRLISLFQNVTKATARDCLEDEIQNKIIYPLPINTLQMKIIPIT